LGVPSGFFIYYCLIGAVSLLGFHGILFYDHLLKKTVSWILFQTGIFLLAWFFSASPAGPNPLSRALAWGILGATLAVSLPLFALSFALFKRFGTLEAGQIVKKIHE
jgi:hypothetical protein